MLVARARVSFMLRQSVELVVVRWTIFVSGGRYGSLDAVADADAGYWKHG